MPAINAPDECSLQMLGPNGLLNFDFLELAFRFVGQKLVRHFPRPEQLTLIHLLSLNFAIHRASMVHVIKT
jgi:hypothetical protein